MSDGALDKTETENVERREGLVRQGRVCSVWTREGTGQKDASGNAGASVHVDPL